MAAAACFLREHHGVLLHDVLLGAQKPISWAVLPPINGFIVF